MIISTPTAGIFIDLPVRLRSPNSFPKRKGSRNILVLLNDGLFVSCRDPREVHYLRPRMAGWTYYTMDSR